MFPNVHVHVASSTEIRISVQRMYQAGKIVHFVKSFPCDFSINEYVSPAI